MDTAKKANVLLIAGFLGSGKTTLLSRILKWPGDLSDTAVLVNEFGAVGIDGALLEGSETPLAELANGCICCTLKGDMIKTVSDIMGTYNPHRLIIEATGVADPMEICDILRSSQLTDHFDKIKTITVLDADYWEGREMFGPLFYNQIKAADLLLFNKIDLLAKEDVSRYMNEVCEVNPRCAIAPTHHCNVDPDVLWEPAASSAMIMTAMPESSEHGSTCDCGNHHEHHDHCECGGEHHHHHHHDHIDDADNLGYSSFVFESDKPFQGECFRQFISLMPINLYRMKGFVLMDGKRFVVNHIGGKTEWRELSESKAKASTLLAFIGWQVDSEEHLIELRSCLIQ